MPRTLAALSGLYFNANLNNNPYVGLASQTPLSGLTAITFECWVYPTAYPSYTARIMSNHDQVKYGFEVNMSPGGNLAGFVGNSTTRTSGGTNNSPLTLNQMHHIAVSWDGTTVRTFVDGLIGGTTNTLSGGNTGTSAQPFLIGNYESGTSRPFPGTISEVRISNVARYTANFTPPTAPFTPDANTVGLYHLNEGQGLVAQDSSSQANHGTLSGSPLPVWSAGKFSGQVGSRTTASNRAGVQNFPCSLNFNGSSSYVSLTQTSGLPIYNFTAYSVAGWFKLTNTSASHCLYSEGNSGSANEFIEIFLITSNQIKVQITNSAGTQILGVHSTSIPYLNQWHHFAWVDVGGTASLYIDGVKDSSNFNYTPSGTFTLNQSTIGALRRNSTGDYFAGNEQAVQLFNYGLSAAQVLQVMNGQLSGNVGNYPLTEGSQSTAYDISGNGNNGTITSGTYTADVPSRTRQLVGGNLIYNGNFEFAPPTNVAMISSNYIDGTSGGSSNNRLFGWAGQTANTSSNATMQFDSSTSHSGNYSMKVSTLTTGQTAAVNQMPNYSVPAQVYASAIPCTPNTSYTLTFWMATTVHSGSANSGGYAELFEFTGAGSFSTSVQSTKVTSTTGWTQYSITTTTGPTIEYLSICLHARGNDGTGTLIMDAWFDDIVLTPTTNTTRSTAV